ncbi:MAG: HEAT repeat domain-containing protein [Planctomycetota bacterium]|nr:HEAT repeat domain-containing protein [Planctomycetota bacterium]
MANPFREKKLLKRLGRGSRASRLVAARAIGRESSFGVLPRLLEMGVGGDGGIVEAPYVAARLLLSRFTVPELCKRLTDRRLPVRVRFSILEEVRIRGERRAAKLLLPVMIAAEPEVSFRASQVMGSVGDGSMVPVLARALSQPQAQAREATALALGLIGSVKAVIPLMPLLGDTEPKVGFTAALALGMIARENSRRAREVWYEEIGGREALTWIIDCTRTKEPSLRAMACFTLGEIGVDRETIIEAVTNRLRDGDATVRQWAAYACGRLGAESVIEKLQELSKDGRSMVRGAAIRALGSLGKRSAVPFALRLLTDRNSRVRNEAEEALERLTYHVYERTGDRPDAPVIHWRRWWQENGKGTRDAWLKLRIQAAIVELESSKLVLRQRAVEFLNEKTKQRHGFHADDSRDVREEAVRTWKVWWHRSREKHPVQWLIDSLRSSDDHRRQAAYLQLKQVTKGLFVFDAYGTITRRNESLRNIDAWWEKNKKMFIDRDVPL